MNAFQAKKKKRKKKSIKERAPYWPDLHKELQNSRNKLAAKCPET